MTTYTGKSAGVDIAEHDAAPPPSSERTCSSRAPLARVAFAHGRRACGLAAAPALA